MPSFENKYVAEEPLSISEIRRYNGRRRLEMTTLTIESNSDGSRDVDFQTDENIPETEFHIRPGTSSKRSLTFTNPEWLVINESDRTFKELDLFWCMERKKVLLFNSNDYIKYLPYFYNATYLILKSSKKIKLEDVLNEMPRLENVVLREKTYCTNEDFRKFADSAKDVHIFDIVISESSNISCETLKYFIEFTRFAEHALVQLGGFRGTRKSLIAAFYRSEIIKNFEIVKNEMKIVRYDGISITLRFDKSLP